MDPKEEPPSTSKSRAEWFELDEDHNTYVYVSGLPKTDFTEQDFYDLMRKYGIIKKKMAPGKNQYPFNIKLYRNKDGSMKGDGLCCYAYVTSVEQALTLLDGSMYDDRHTIHCERAKFELKGEYDASKKPRKLDKKAKMKQKKALERLLSWEPTSTAAKRQRKVILSKVFEPDEIVEDPTLILSLKQAVEQKCEEIKCQASRVDICDKHPEGIVEVTFADADQAEKAASALDDQPLYGRTIKAIVWDGKTKYRIKETDEEVQSRLDKWHNDLEKSDDEQS